MNIGILSLAHVLVDGQTVGRIADVFAKFPASADELQAALEQREKSLRADAAGQAGADLMVARAEIARLEALLNPPPLPEYFQIVALPQPDGDATHAGIRRPPAIGGEWEFDLLAVLPGDEGRYRLVMAGCTAPADAALTSLSGLKASAAIADITVALEAKAAAAKSAKQ